MEIQVSHDIGNYHILAVIAQGAYSNVYKASHVILTSRIVAVKILHTPFIEGGKSEDVFYQEARILEPIKHPYILPILDVSVYQNLPYIVKEFAPHGSLLDRVHKLHGHVMPLGDALPILKQIGEGLQYVHDHRIVHCDLKPANILFSAEKDAQIADFDISRVLHSVNGSSPAIGGTPSYMSPEHFQGKVRCASDQYALGCMTYELLSGKRPFEGRDYEDLKRKHMSEAPVPLTQLNPHVPVQIEQAVSRAMAKRYEDRFPNVAAFIDALQSASGELASPSVHVTEPVSATPVHKAAPRSKHPTEERLILKPTKGSTPVDDDIYYEATVVGNELILGKDDPAGGAHRRHAASLYEAQTLPAPAPSARKKTTTSAAKTEDVAAPKKKVSRAKATNAEAKTAPAKKTTRAPKADIHTAPTQKEKATPGTGAKVTHKTGDAASKEAAAPKKTTRTKSATTAKKVAPTVPADKPATTRKRAKKVSTDAE